MDTKELEALKDQIQGMIFFWSHKPEDTTDALVEKIFALEGMKKLVEGK